MADPPRTIPHRAGENVVAIGAAPARGELAPRRWVTALTVFGVSATLIWLVAALFYVDRMIGWEALRGLALREHAVLVAGIAAPLLVLWLAIGVIDRGRELRYQVDRLGRQIDALTYRPGDAKAKLDIYADALREQARILNDASQAAANQVEDGRRTIAAQIRDLTNVGDQVALRSNQTLAVLRRHIDSVERLGALMQTRLHALESQSGAQADLLNTASERAATQAQAMGETLAKGVDELTQAGDRGTLAAQVIREELALQGRALSGVAERTIQAAAAMQRARAAFEAAAQPMLERGIETGQAVSQIAQEFIRLTAALDGYGERLGVVLARHVGQFNAVTGHIKTRTEEAGAALTAQMQAIAALQDRAGGLLRQLQEGTDGAEQLSVSLSGRLEAAASRMTVQAETMAAVTGTAAQQTQALLVAFAEAELGTTERARAAIDTAGRLETQLADLARRAANIASSATASADRARSAEAAVAAGAEATLSALRAGAQWVAESCSRSATELREVIATLRSNADATLTPAAPPPADLELRRQAFLRATRIVLDGLTALGHDLRRALNAPAQGDHALIEAIRARASGDPEFGSAMHEFIARFADTLARAREADPAGVMPLTLLASDLGRIYALLLAAEQREV